MGRKRDKDGNGCTATGIRTEWMQQGYGREGPRRNRDTEGMDATGIRLGRDGMQQEYGQERMQQDIDWKVSNRDTDG